ncbi:S-layer homology domain-containing protein [Ruminiclostridium cellobioparum]|uniref:S-layer domain-containing protein n=1 Tax=Ruminiclostridium cellobioparum subsp. termitidis CT1112 TaxID=1195236 RepID=S0FMV4_RUMCE|nr:S-layer homology domain-containing protein [Ruminiclostridium cellobioparum]EMS70439.1 S-layer domain-containing protein [Ruminiclostridium cellobioparum subsp. termitidis CT1112]
MSRSVKKLLSVIIIACVVISSTISPVVASNYSDTKTHWAKDRIDRWTGLGIFNGYNNKFRPNDYITRGELAVVINNIMKYQDKAENTFKDLDQKFYTDALLKANYAGIINGSNKEIRPKDNATREEAAAILVNAFSIKANTENDYLKFSDSAQISSWAVSSVNAMAGNGYVNGDQKKRFNPKSNITRAEIVTILDNCIKAIYSKEGIYNSDIVNGNIIINNPGITLKDMTVNGNIIISQGAADGNVRLENVKINGDIIVKGGANVYIGNSSVSGTITINKADGKISLTASGTTAIEKILLNSGAIIDSRDLKSGEIRCVEISSSIPKGHIVKLYGIFKLVINNAKDIDIEATGTIEKLQLNQKCILKGGAYIKSISVAEGADSVINGKKVPESNAASSTASSSSNQSSAKTSYIVTFQANGGTTVPAMSVLSGEKITLPSAPSYSGYIFMGWFTDKDLTTEFNQNMPITSNITLYAKWSGWNKPVTLDERFEEGYPKFSVTGDKKIKLIVKLKDASNENPVDVFMLVNQMNPLFDATSEEVIHGHCGAEDGLVEVDEAPFLQVCDTNEHEVATQVTVKGINNIKMYFVLKGSTGVISQEPVMIEFLSADTAQQDNTAPVVYNNGIYINRSYNKITLYFDEALNTDSIPETGAFTITNNTTSPGAITTDGDVTSPAAISITGISLRNIAPDKGTVELSVDGINDFNNDLTISYNKLYQGDSLQDNAAAPNKVESFLNIPVKTVNYGISSNDTAVSSQGKYIYIKMNFALLDYNSYDFTIDKGPDRQHLTPVNTESDVLRIWSNSGDYHKLYICLDNVPSLSEGDKYFIMLTPAPKDGTTATNFSGETVNFKIAIEITPGTTQEAGIMPDSITYSSSTNSIKVNLPQVNNLYSDGGMFGCLFTLKVDGVSYTLRGKVFNNNGQIVINQKNVPVELSKIDWSTASLTYSASIHDNLDSDSQLTYKSGMPFGGFEDVPITIVP